MRLVSPIMLLLADHLGSDCLLLFRYIIKCHFLQLTLKLKFQNCHCRIRTKEREKKIQLKIHHKIIKKKKIENEKITSNDEHERKGVKIKSTQINCKN